MANSSIRWRVLNNRIPEITAEVEARAQELAVSTREEIAHEARQNAPVGTEAEGDKHPGLLRDSIHVEETKVIADAEDANFVEHGTVYMAAQPFFAPAVEKGKRVMRAGLAKLIG